MCETFTKIIMATGGIISMLAMCVSTVTAFTCTTPEQSVSLVGFIAGAGYGLRVLLERRREMQIEMFYFHQADKLDGDMEFIGIEEVGK